MTPSGGSDGTGCERPGRDHLRRNVRRRSPFPALRTGQKLAWPGSSAPGRRLRHRPRGSISTRPGVTRTGGQPCPAAPRAARAPRGRLQLDGSGAEAGGGLRPAQHPAVGRVLHEPPPPAPGGRSVAARPAFVDGDEPAVPVALLVLPLPRVAAARRGADQPQRVPGAHAERLSHRGHRSSSAAWFSRRRVRGQGTPTAWLGCDSPAGPVGIGAPLPWRPGAPRGETVRLRSIPDNRQGLYLRRPCRGPALRAEPRRRAERPCGSPTPARGSLGAGGPLQRRRIAGPRWARVSTARHEGGQRRPRWRPYRVAAQRPGLLDEPSPKAVDGRRPPDRSDRLQAGAELPLHRRGRRSELRTIADQEGVARASPGQPNGSPGQGAVDRHLAGAVVLHMRADLKDAVAAVRHPQAAQLVGPHPGERQDRDEGEEISVSSAKHGREVPVRERMVLRSGFRWRAPGALGPWPVSVFDRADMGGHPPACASRRRGTTAARPGVLCVAGGWPIHPRPQCHRASLGATSRLPPDVALRSNAMPGGGA